MKNVFSNVFGEVGVDYTVEDVREGLKKLLSQLEEAAEAIVPRSVRVPKFSAANVEYPDAALKDVMEAFTEMELQAISVHIRYEVMLAVLKSKFIVDFHSTAQLIEENPVTYCVSGLYESETMQEAVEALGVAS